jgi:hypothetical protein
MLLTLNLIEHPEPGRPAPVLLPIASWNPAEEPVHDFIARRLGEEYQFLTETAEDGQTLAQLLMALGRVLPVLDGLDELPVDMHPQAVESLDRSREDEQAVGSSGAVMSRSAVVEIEPVSAEQAIVTRLRSRSRVFAGCEALTSMFVLLGSGICALAGGARAVV